MYIDKLTAKDIGNDHVQKDELIISSEAFRKIDYDFSLSDKRLPDKIKAATDLCDIIRKNLWFEPLNADTPVLSEQFIDTEHRTNCFGYTIVCSECLDKLSMDHNVAFANGHSFVLIRDMEGCYLCDSTSKDVSGQITGNLDNNFIDKHLKENGCTDVYLNTRLIKLNDESCLGFDELAIGHPWMSFHNYERDYDRKDCDDRLIMKIYDSKGGRGMLETYSHLLSFNLNRDYKKAALSISELGELYPNIDSRNHFYEIRDTIRGLISDGDYDLAKSVINNDLHKINFGHSLEAAFLVPKLNRALGKTALDVEILEAASSSYKNIEIDKNYSHIIRESAGRAVKKINNDIHEIN
jgi:hypothetical protein